MTNPDEIKGVTKNTATTDLTETDVTIVGGGMVGLALAQMMANSFSQTGTAKKVTLIETFPIVDTSVENTQPYQPSFDSRSTAISGGSVELLERAGIWEQIAEHVTAIEKVHVSDRGHIGSTCYSKDDNHGQALGYVVENAWLGRVLASVVLNCEGVNVVAPAQVEAIFPKRDGALLTYVKNDEAHSLKSDVVIIADGSDSPLRKKLGMGVTVHDYQQHAIVANVSYDKSHEGMAFERFTEDGPLALLPLGENSNSRTSALVWTRAGDAVDEIMSCSDEHFLNHLQQVFGYRLGAFTSVSKRSNYPLQLLLAKEQARSSIVLMGNAAHFLHPVAGQGFNLALRDCATLIDVLCAAVANHKRLGTLDVLQQYVDKQRADQSATSWISHSFIGLFASKKAPVQLGRNLALLGMDSFSSARQAFFSQMMGKGLIG